MASEIRCPCCKMSIDKKKFSIDYQNINDRETSLRSCDFIKQSNYDINKFTKAGWFCNGSDSLQCFFCGCIVKNWKKDDNPEERHMNTNPKCLYMLQCCSNYDSDKNLRDMLRKVLHNKESKYIDAIIHCIRQQQDDMISNQKLQNIELYANDLDNLIDKINNGGKKLITATKIIKNGSNNVDNNDNDPMENYNFISKYKLPTAKKQQSIAKKKKTPVSIKKPQTQTSHPRRAGFV